MNPTQFDKVLFPQREIERERERERELALTRSLLIPLNRDDENVLPLLVNLLLQQLAALCLLPSSFPSSSQQFGFLLLLDVFNAEELPPKASHNL
jgi:hypothetical protein